MDLEKQNMIDRVMKLLELGKDGNGAFTPEQEAANNMAAKLMAKYSIDIADLRNGKPKSGIFENHTVDPMDDCYCDWEASLAGCIAKAFDCHVVNSKFPTWKLRFLGTKSDLEISIFFYRHLRRTVGRKAELSFKRQADRVTYAYGMVDTIRERLTDLYQRREAVMESDCRAMVVVKKDGLKDFIREQFPNLTHSKATKLRGSQEAWNQGKADGKTVGLNRPIQGHARHSSISALKH